MSLAQAVQQLPPQAPLLGKQIDESQELVQQLSQEIRTMSYLLHPPLLDETGLSEALHWYIRDLSERSGFSSPETPSNFSPGRSQWARFENHTRRCRGFRTALPRNGLAMFRLVQESLTNIHRHSGSKSAVIRLACNADSVSLEVQDKGKGIFAERLAQIQSQGSGVGIRGMRERARHFGGHMMIESNQRGTKISFQFPLSANSSSKTDSTVDLENSDQPAPIVG
ncbi:MAG TPA: ATP-binding protein [Candidatus Sulfotelmatobacter sp.]